MSERAFSPNRGNKCFFSMKRRCVCVECLYIGSTEACHSFANVRNVMQDRVGDLLPDAAGVLCAKMSDASRRDIGASFS
jgi:hypothetical protein